MRVGTASLLIGVHQFAWHPLTVALAWRWLYARWPTLREAVCIVIHDWGYFAKTSMDNAEGETHPELGARIAGRLLGHDAYLLCIGHSRHYARTWQIEPSRLCWADKGSLLFERWWTYLPRAWASGELHEYRQVAADAGVVPLSASHREWFRVMQERFRRLSETQNPAVVSYVNPQRAVAALDAGVHSPGDQSAVPGTK